MQSSLHPYCERIASRADESKANFLASTILGIILKLSPSNIKAPAACEQAHRSVTTRFAFLLLLFEKSLVMKRFGILPL